MSVDALEQQLDDFFTDTGAAALRDAAATPAQHIAALTVFYRALAPPVHCGDFRNVAPCFDTLFHDSVCVIYRPPLKYDKRQWRGVISGMVRNNVSLKSFAVLSHTSECVQFTATFQEGGVLRSNPLKATFAEAKCVRLEPYLAIGGTNHVYHERAVWLLYSPLEDPNQGSRKASFLAAYDVLVHERLMAHVPSGARGKPEWRAVWADLLSFDARGSDLVLYQSEGDQCTYCLRLTVGGTAVVHHERATFRDGRLVRLDVLDFVAWQELLVASLAVEAPPESPHSAASSNLSAQRLARTSPSAGSLTAVPGDWKTTSSPWKRRLVDSPMNGPRLSLLDAPELHLLLLTQYHQTLTPERNGGDFGTVERHFDLLMHERLRVHLSIGPCHKTQYRGIMAGLVRNKLRVTDFTVLRCNIDVITFSYTEDVFGGTRHVQCKARFKDYQCIAIEPSEDMRAEPRRAGAGGKADAATPLPNGALSAPMSPNSNPERWPADPVEHQLALLTAFYEALAREVHRNSFANVEGHFEALLHEDACICLSQQALSKAQWRGVLSDLIETDGEVRNFTVLKYGDDAVVHSFTLEAHGVANFLCCQASFAAGRCIRIAPCAFQQGPNHLFYRRAIGTLYGALGRGQRTNAAQRFLATLDELLHDRFTACAGSASRTKGQWQALWEDLLVAGVVADRLTVHYSEGPVCGYSVQLTVAGTTVVHHERVTFRGDQLLQLDVVAPRAWHRLLSAVLAPRSPADRRRRRPQRLAGPPSPPLSAADSPASLGRSGPATPPLRSKALPHRDPRADDEGPTVSEADRLAQAALHLRLLEAYHRALTPAAHRRDFRNVAPAFEALLHADCRVQCAQQALGQAQWRQCVEDMVQRDVDVRCFAVSQQSADVVTYWTMSTSALLELVEYRCWRATFSEGQCILLESQNTAWEERACHEERQALVTFFRHFSPPRRPSSTEQFLQGLNSSLTDSFRGMLCGQAVPLAPWREVWARLAEEGLTADGVKLHYAVDAGCGFSVRLGLGERSVTVHGTAAVRGRQLAAMELVEPPDWLRRLAPEPSGQEASVPAVATPPAAPNAPTAPSAMPPSPAPRPSPRTRKAPPRALAGRLLPALPGGRGRPLRPGTAQAAGTVPGRPQPRGAGPWDAPALRPKSAPPARPESPAPAARLATPAASGRGPRKLKAWQSSVNHLTLLTQFYEALVPEVHQQGFAAVGKLFDAVMHHDVRVVHNGQVMDRAAWRSHMSDLVARGLHVEDFLVLSSSSGEAVFCAVYQLEGQLQHWLQQATFLDGQCVRLEPAQSAKEQHSQATECIARMYSALLQPSGTTTRLGLFLASLEATLHEGFMAHTPDGLRSKAEWRAQWAALAEAGLRLEDLELHCSNGNVVWYSLHVTVGATTLVVHEKATLSRDRIARIDLVSGTTWSQLLGITSGREEGGPTSEEADPTAQCGTLATWQRAEVETAESEGEGARVPEEPTEAESAKSSAPETEAAVGKRAKEVGAAAWETVENEGGAPEELTEAERTTASESATPEAEAIVSEGAEEEVGAAAWEMSPLRRHMTPNLALFQSTASGDGAALPSLNLLVAAPEAESIAASDDTVFPSLALLLNAAPEAETTESEGVGATAPEELTVAERTSESTALEAEEVLVSEGAAEEAGAAVWEMSPFQRHMTPNLALFQSTASGDGAALPSLNLLLAAAREAEAEESEGGGLGAPEETGADRETTSEAAVGEGAEEQERAAAWDAAEVEGGGAGTPEEPAAVSERAEEEATASPLQRHVTPNLALFQSIAVSDDTAHPSLGLLLDAAPEAASRDPERATASKSTAPELEVDVSEGAEEELGAAVWELAAWRWGSPTGGEGDTGAPEEPTEAERATASESVAAEAEAVVSKGAEEEAGAAEWEVSPLQRHMTPNLALFQSIAAGDNTAHPSLNLLLAAAPEAEATESEGGGEGASEEPTEAERATASESTAPAAEAEEEAGAAAWEMSEIRRHVTPNLAFCNSLTADGNTAFPNLALLLDIVPEARGPMETEAERATAPETEAGPGERVEGAEEEAMAAEWEGSCPWGGASSSPTLAFLRATAEGDAALDSIALVLGTEVGTACPECFWPPLEAADSFTPENETQQPCL